jgi:hypothetical protein
MSRSIRLLVALLVVSFALAASACADATGPSHAACDYNNGNVCH